MATKPNGVLSGLLDRIRGKKKIKGQRPDNFFDGYDPDFEDKMANLDKQIKDITQGIKPNAKPKEKFVANSRLRDLLSQKETLQNEANMSSDQGPKVDDSHSVNYMPEINRLADDVRAAIFRRRDPDPTSIRTSAYQILDFIEDFSFQMSSSEKSQAKEVYRTLRKEVKENTGINLDSLKEDKPKRPTGPKPTWAQPKSGGEGKGPAAESDQDVNARPSGPANN